VDWNFNFRICGNHGDGYPIIWSGNTNANFSPGSQKILLKIHQNTPFESQQFSGDPDPLPSGLQYSPPTKPSGSASASCRIPAWLVRLMLLPIPALLGDGIISLLCAHDNEWWIWAGIYIQVYVHPSGRQNLWHAAPSPRIPSVLLRVLVSKAYDTLESFLSKVAFGRNLQE